MEMHTCTIQRLGASPRSSTCIQCMGAIPRRSPCIQGTAAGALVGLGGLGRAAADHAAAEAQHDLVQVHQLDEVTARRLRASAPNG